MSKRTLALIIVLLIVTGVLIAVAVTNPQPPSPSNVPQATKVLPTPAAQTTLELSPNPLTLTAQSETINVEIDSGNNKVTAVQLELSYDPKAITSLIITPSLFFENPVVLLNNVDAKNGKVSYALAISPTGNPKVGKGTVATINVKTALAQNQQTSITVLPKSLVTAEGVDTSVLKTSSGVSIIYSPQTTQPTQ